MTARLPWGSPRPLVQQWGQAGSRCLALVCRKDGLSYKSRTKSTGHQGCHRRARVMPL